MSSKHNNISTGESKVHVAWNTTVKEELPDGLSVLVAIKWCVWCVKYWHVFSNVSHIYDMCFIVFSAL